MKYHDPFTESDLDQWLADKDASANTMPPDPITTFSDADTMLAENDASRKNGGVAIWTDEQVHAALVADGADDGDAWSVVEAATRPTDPITTFSDADLDRMVQNAWREAARSWQEYRTADRADTLLRNSAREADTYYEHLLTELQRRKGCGAHKSR